MTRHQRASKYGGDCDLLHRQRALKAGYFGLAIDSQLLLCWLRLPRRVFLARFFFVLMLCVTKHQQQRTDPRLRKH